MEASRFDRLARTLSSGGTRRGALRLLATLPVVSGLVGPLDPDAAEARGGRHRRRVKRHKHGKGRHRKKRRQNTKVRFNAFGCVNVGGLCKNGGQCCSGICSGKKGKRTCEAHDQSTCQPGQSFSPCGMESTPCTTSSGDPGGCFLTTGGAGYCQGDGACFPCQKDADCVAVCGAGAACVPCAAGCPDDGTACLGVSTLGCIDQM